MVSGVTTGNLAQLSNMKMKYIPDDGFTGTDSIGYGYNLAKSVINPLTPVHAGVTTVNV